MPPTADVTLVVKTFERPRHLQRLIATVRKDFRYRQLPIVVADDSREPQDVADTLTTVLKLPFDIGISAGRNLALQEVTTPYVVLLDDDMQIYPGTDLRAMHRILKEGTFDLVGGQMGNTQFHGCYVVEDGVLHQYFGAWIAAHERHYQCHFTHNFFMARTDAVRDVGWDEELKCHREHDDFFLRAMWAGLKCAYYPWSCVSNTPWHPEVPTNDSQAVFYRSLRRRNYTKRFMEKHQFKQHVLHRHMGMLVHEHETEDA